MGARRPDEDCQRRADPGRSHDARTDQRARSAGARRAAALAERLYRRAARGRWRRTSRASIASSSCRRVASARPATGRRRRRRPFSSRSLHAAASSPATTSRRSAAGAAAGRAAADRQRGPVFNTFPQPQVVNPTGRPAAFPGQQGAFPGGRSRSPRQRAAGGAQQQTPQPAFGATPTAPYGGVAVPGMIAAPPRARSPVRCSSRSARPGCPPSRHVESEASRMRSLTLTESYSIAAMPFIDQSRRDRRRDAQARTAAPERAAHAQSGADEPRSRARPRARRRRVAAGRQRARQAAPRFDRAVHEGRTPGSRRQGSRRNPRARDVSAAGRRSGGDRTRRRRRDRGDRRHVRRRTWAA